VFGRPGQDHRDLRGCRASRGFRDPAGRRAAGAAVAYAHVHADGTVDAANSKNVTAANVTTDASFPGAYCFHDLPFSFNNAVVSVDWSDLSHFADPMGIVQFALKNPTSNVCVNMNDIQGIVFTSDGGVGFIPHAFFIIFN